MLLKLITMTFTRSLTKTTLSTTAAAISLVVLGSNAQAASFNLLGNIAGVPSSFQFTTTTIDSGIGQSKAVQFTTPTSPTPLYLESIQLYLAGLDTTDNPLVQIYRGTASSPVAGTTVTLSNPNPPPLPNSDPGVGANTVYNFLGRSPFVYEFLPNTLYTLQVSATAGAFNWVRDTASTNVTPTGIGTFDSYQFRSATGGTFSSSSVFNNFGITATDIPQAQVPEPSSVLGILALGILGGASALKNRSKN